MLGSLFGILGHINEQLITTVENFWLKRNLNYIFFPPAKMIINMMIIYGQDHDQLLLYNHSHIHNYLHSHYNLFNHYVLH